MNNDKLLTVALGRISGISSKKLIRLVERRFLSPRNLANASENELRKFFKREKTVSQILSLNENSDDKIHQLEEALRQYKEKKVNLVTYFDEDYPEMLKQIGDPPLYLFIKGKIIPKDINSFSIIGTRNPTSYGRIKAREIARDLVDSGFTIISGLARGIDTEAHMGALEAGGRTIAVIGSGILKIYPPENSELADDIFKNGAIISESFPYESVKKFTLQKRNKLNCGLSRGSIFIEGTESSGTKWQIKYAREQKKPLFGLKPLDITRKTSYISHYIVKKLHGYSISSAADVLEQYNSIKQSNSSKNIASFIQ